MSPVERLATILLLAATSQTSAMRKAIRKRFVPHGADPHMAAAGSEPLSSLCGEMTSPAEQVLGLFRRPEDSAGLPWFNYVLWLDQAGLMGGSGMSSIDPEALAYIAPPPQLPGSVGVNRCGLRQWTVFGNNISGAGDSDLTYQGPDFLGPIRDDDDRCTLNFEANAEGSDFSITNYFWATFRNPLLDPLMSLTITLSPQFHRLFQGVQRAGAAEFGPALRRAAEAEAEWGSTCCPGAFANTTALASGDVLVACGPPLTPDCALWSRANWPAAPGFGGYSVYAVAYGASGSWVPVPQAAGGTAYAKFEEKMQSIGVGSICFERDA